MTKAERNAKKIKEVEDFLIQKGVPFARPAEYHFKVNDINIYATTGKYFIDGASSAQGFSLKTLEAVFKAKGYLGDQPVMRLVQ